MTDDRVKLGQIYKKKPVERLCTKIIAAGVSIKSKEMSAENLYAQKNI